MMEMREPIDPNRFVTIRLRAPEWSVVLAGLNELPHRVSRQIFDSLLQQLRQEQSSSSTEAVERAIGDGDQSHG